MKKIILWGLGISYFLSGQAQVFYMQNGASVTLQSAAEMTIQGDAQLVNGSNLLNEGIIHFMKGTETTANWTDNTTAGYYYGNGTFIFGSPETQTLYSLNGFNRIEVNNGGLNLGSTINSNSWYLQNGIIHTGSFLAITNGTTAADITAAPSNAGFTNSWFNGTLRRFITTNAVDSYIFPVGNATRSNMAELFDLTGSPLTNITYLDAFFAPKAGTDAGLAVSESGTAYTGINDGGIWHLVPDAAPSSGQYNLRLHINGFTGLLDNRFAILRRPEGAANGADWMIPPGSTVLPDDGDGRLLSHGYARRNELSTFSEFGIGQLLNPLPVTLADFDAVRLNHHQVKLDWETRSEQNNKGFQVERRLSNENSFTVRGFVASLAPGGNSSNDISYTFGDENNYSGISYYRLLQIDIDLHAVYTHIKAVKGNGNTSVLLKIAPNPSNGQFTISIDNADGPKKAVITSLSGKTVQQLQVQNKQQVNISHLSAGTYVITILDVFGKGEHFREKILVVH